MTQNQKMSTKIMTLLIGHQKIQVKEIQLRAIKKMISKKKRRKARPKNRIRFLQRHLKPFQLKLRNYNLR